VPGVDARHLLPRDTTAAIATPSGRGAIAVIRVSGPGARGILERLAGCAPPPPRLQRLSALRHPVNDALLDRALVSWFPAPASYTGEDVLEIACHGGAIAPHLVLDGVFAAGARPALAGEFTRRALLHGKLDLLQAEAIGDLVEATSPAAHRAAIHHVERGLSRRIDALREALIGVEALISYSIDFPDEDEPPVPPERILTEALAVVGRMRDLVATAPQGELLRNGALTVLAGRPNAGKSSLFNALLGLERAIVTEVPGTTRDAVEALASIGGHPFRLVDTAGLHETADRVEGIGIEIARRYVERADLVIFCVPANRDPLPDELDFIAAGDPRVIPVRTMADLARDEPTPAIVVSAVTGAGLELLSDALVGHAFGGDRALDAEAPILTRERHVRALSRAMDDLLRFRDAVDEGVPMEFAATHLQDAIAGLEGLIGLVEPEDVLDRVFQSFCVGK
jgi:tRNA modification GTPase